MHLPAQACLTPLISANGQNILDDFRSEELVHSYIQHRVVENLIGYDSQVVADIIVLPSAVSTDIVERLLSRRKSLEVFSSSNTGKGGDQWNEDTPQDVVTKLDVHAWFVSSPSVGGAALTVYPENKFVDEH